MFSGSARHSTHRLASTGKAADVGCVGAELGLLSILRMARTAILLRPGEVIREVAHETWAICPEPHGRVAKGIIATGTSTTSTHLLSQTISKSHRMRLFSSYNK